jgi:cytochrome c oxidase subunit 4
MVDKGTAHQVQSYRELALVLAALLGLTTLTVTVSRWDLGVFRIWTAIFIAACKATLVLYFFMKLGRAGKVIGYTFTITIVLLAIFISFIFFDIAYR